MATTVLLLELAVVLAMIFIGARMGGIGLGIFGMLGVFVLVYGFGLKPGSAPIDVMMIILAVVTAAAALQAAGGLEYLVGQAAIFLRKHPHHITYYGPLCTWLFCLVAGTAHTCYSLLPIISEIALSLQPRQPSSPRTSWAAREWSWVRSLWSVYPPRWWPSLWPPSSKTVLVRRWRTIRSISAASERG